MSRKKSAKSFEDSALSLYFLLKNQTIGKNAHTTAITMADRKFATFTTLFLFRFLACAGHTALTAAAAAAATAHIAIPAVFYHLSDYCRQRSSNNHNNNEICHIMIPFFL